MIDPIEELAALAQEANCGMHVDSWYIFCLFICFAIFFLKKKLIRFLKPWWLHFAFFHQTWLHFDQIRLFNSWSHCNERWFAQIRLWSKTIVCHSLQNTWIEKISSKILLFCFGKKKPKEKDSNMYFSFMLLAIRLVEIIYPHHSLEVVLVRNDSFWNLFK